MADPRPLEQLKKPSKKPPRHCCQNDVIKIITIFWASLEPDLHVPCNVKPERWAQLRITASAPAVGEVWQQTGVSPCLTPLQATTTHYLRWVSTQGYRFALMLYLGARVHSIAGGPELNRISWRFQLPFVHRQVLSQAEEITIAQNIEGLKVISCSRKHTTESQI